MCRQERLPQLYPKSSAMVVHSELIRAVRNSEPLQVAKWGRLASDCGCLELRTQSADEHPRCALSASPLTYLVYRAGELLPGTAARERVGLLIEKLLAHLAEDDINARPAGWCSSCSSTCRSGGFTALQLACIQGSVSKVPSPHLSALLLAALTLVERDVAGRVRACAAADRGVALVAVLL